MVGESGAAQARRKSKRRGFVLDEALRGHTVIDRGDVLRIGEARPGLREESAERDHPTGTVALFGDGRSSR